MGECCNEMRCSPIPSIVVFVLAFDERVMFAMSSFVKFSFCIKQYVLVDYIVWLTWRGSFVVLEYIDYMYI